MALLQDNYLDERDFLDSILISPQQPSHDHNPQTTQSLLPDPTTVAEIDEWLNTDETGEPTSENQNFLEFQAQDPLVPIRNESVHRFTPRASLSWEAISQHFYKPCPQAAKELGVCRRQLQIRCRELGINCWPYQKIRSIQTVIRNVRDLSQTSEEESDIVSGDTIQKLEDTLREIVANPNLPLDDRLMRFKRKCYKAKYLKKRKRGEGTSTASAPLVNQEDSMPEVIILSDSESKDDKEDEGIRGSRYISEFYP